MKHYDGRAIVLLVDTEGFRLGRKWANHTAEAHDADLAAFLTQKYRYMPSSSPLTCVVGLYGRA